MEPGCARGCVGALRRPFDLLHVAGTGRTRSSTSTGWGSTHQISRPLSAKMRNSRRHTVSPSRRAAEESWLIAADTKSRRKVGLPTARERTGACAIGKTHGNCSRNKLKSTPTADSNGTLLRVQRWQQYSSGFCRKRFRPALVELVGKGKYDGCD